MRTRVYHTRAELNDPSRPLTLVIETFAHYLVTAGASTRVYALPKADYQLTEPTEGDDLV